MTALWNDATCRVGGKRRRVAALQIRMEADFVDEAGALHVVNQDFRFHRPREIFLQVMREVAGRAVLGMGNLPVKRAGQIQALLVRGLNRLDALDDFLFQLRWLHFYFVEDLPIFLCRQFLPLF